MLNDLLRTIGAACIIAGAALYFAIPASDDAKVIAENEQLQAEIDSLQSVLAQTEKELANVQSLAVNAEKSADELENEQEDADNPQEKIAKFVLQIEEGTTSQVVATQLEQAEIIEDAEQFNAYLTDNDLSGKIQIGEYELDASMSIQTIANAITSK